MVQTVPTPIQCESFHLFLLSIRLWHPDCTLFLHHPEFFLLQKRPIPFLFRKESRFGDVVQTQDKIISKEEWQKFLNGEQSILIPPNAKVSVEISAGVERTAYLHLALDRVQRRRFLFFSQKDMYLEENEVI